MESQHTTTTSSCSVLIERTVSDLTLHTMVELVPKPSTISYLRLVIGEFAMPEVSDCTDCWYIKTHIDSSTRITTTTFVLSE
jgi:hypothetical protein